MLGEAFLIELLYKEQKYANCCTPLMCRKTSNDEKETRKSKLPAVEDNLLSPVKMENQEKTVKGCLIEQNNDINQIKPVDEITTTACKGTSLPGNVTIALPIPKREQHDDRQLDLYRSWSCTSICQNYPDLQIGGDRVGNMYDSGCFVEHTHEDVFNGPLLLSVDIALGHSPVIEPPEKLPASKFLNGDEIREKSILFHKQPLSNSMLNSYMEKKVEELYKQFLEENLTRCRSITNLMASNLLMNNVNQISLQISQEQNIEASKARDALLHSLVLYNRRNVSHRNSSEFSTPNLQISNQTSRELL
ncbi:TLR adapter interacting with SLC15A4 on the lysosome-like [Ochotona curzoniae]|uniref:TLR adapter interacting with SLC15A4 on the lysosome-like n=1 Tax=Ochotona curzoniae TaxID=130825 RepID=UPI001B347B1E|nr:TLR adapter interacting with SLC15A4 on the lysosome-like [Ochotona curzoniae]XP_040855664.1 TLR adapter interacting with SLC15A4 on the lysosome-like [Ochotona curzoniae]